MSSPLTPGRGFGLYRGTQTEQNIAQPAAGAEWSFTLKGRSWWRLIAGRIPLVCSVAAPVRNVGFEIADDVHIYHTLVSDASLGAADSAIISYGTGPSQFALTQDGGFVSLELIDVILKPGWTIRSKTPGLDAADQYGAGFLLFEEYYLGPEGGGIGNVPTIEQEAHWIAHALHQHRMVAH